MSTIYYNAILNSVIIVETGDEAWMSVFYELAIKGKKYGWIELGEL